VVQPRQLGVGTPTPTHPPHPTPCTESVPRVEQKAEHDASTPRLHFCLALIGNNRLRRAARTVAASVLVDDTGHYCSSNVRSCVCGVCVCVCVLVEGSESVLSKSLKDTVKVRDAATNNYDRTMTGFAQCQQEVVARCHLTKPYFAQRNLPALVFCCAFSAAAALVVSIDCMCVDEDVTTGIAM